VTAAGFFCAIDFTAIDIAADRHRSDLHREDFWFGVSTPDHRPQYCKRRQPSSAQHLLLAQTIMRRCVVRTGAFRVCGRHRAKSYSDFHLGSILSCTGAQTVAEMSQQGIKNNRHNRSRNGATFSRLVREGYLTNPHKKKFAG